MIIFQAKFSKPYFEKLILVGISLMSEPKNVRSDARPNWKLCYERFPVALVGFPPNTVHCQLRNGAPTG